MPPSPARGHRAGWLLVSAERGDLANEFIEITAAEADLIVERIRARVTGSTHD